MRSPTNQHALVLSPHPDDESLGCGGTIKLITSNGGAVDVGYVTRGEQGHYPGVRSTAEACEALAAKRSEEAQHACEVLGVRDVFFLHGKDGYVGQQPQLAQELAELLRRGHYQSVFCPWPYDGHGDHSATYVWLHHALESYADDIDVWLYEVWTPLMPNIHIAIDGTIQAKIRAAAAHESQVSMLNYVEAFRGLARYRGLSCPPAREAEGFYVADRLSLLRHEDVPWQRPAGLPPLARMQ